METIPRHILRKKSMDQRKSLVLIVDDDRLTLELIAEILSSEYRVITASDAMKGREEAVNNKPDVILTDLEMPEMDGNEFFESLREHEETRFIPVILMTARNSTSDEIMALNAGFFDFISKPFLLSNLNARIKKALHTHGCS